VTKCGESRENLVEQVKKWGVPFTIEKAGGILRDQKKAFASKTPLVASGS